MTATCAPFTPLVNPFVAAALNAADSICVALAALRSCSAPAIAALSTPVCMRRRWSKKRPVSAATATRAQMATKAITVVART